MADGPPAVDGVDYAWSRPDIGQLAAAGKRFACRYGGAGSIGKQLDPAEAQALSAAGIAIVANVEGAADGLLGGWSTGASWARNADAHFRSCGMPDGRPIYLSVDFNVSSTQWPAVAQALRGAASVIGAHRVGVYGGRRAVEWARRDHVAQWFWQTYAWSSGVWVPGNHIEQYLNGVGLAGATLDLDRALTADFGQWTMGDEMSAQTEEHVEYAAWRLEALTHMRETVLGGPNKGENVELVTAVKALDAKVAALTVPAPVPVDVAALVAALRPELEAAAERAVRKALGSLDEETTQP